MQTVITVDKKQLAEAVRLLQHVKGGVGKVMIRTLRRVVNTGRTDISRAVRKEIALPKKETDKAISNRLLLKAPDYSGIISIRRKAAPLRHYKPIQRAKGVSVLVRKSEGRQILASTFAFVSRRYSSTLQVAERQRLGGSGSQRVGRLPIQARFGPTVHGVFENNPLGDRALRDLSIVFHKRLEHETKFEIMRAARRNNARA